MKVIFCTIFLLLLGARSLPAQTAEALPSGEVNYEVTVVFGKNSYQEGVTLVKRYQLTFNPSFVKGEQIGDAPNNFSVTNRLTKEKRFFSNYFGHHLELMNMPAKASAVPRVFPQEETREIAGYQCHLVLLQFPEGTYEAWVTNEIGVNFPEYVNGCALEFSVPFSQGYRVYKAIVVDEGALADEKFIVHGYERISQDEMKDRFGPQTVNRN